MNEVGPAFISEARSLLLTDYLPKIEQCAALLSDEQIWWRANPESNSIGNLLLHLSGNVRQWIVVGLRSEERRVGKERIAWWLMRPWERAMSSKATIGRPIVE